MWIYHFFKIGGSKMYGLSSSNKACELIVKQRWYHVSLGRQLGWKKQTKTAETDGKRLATTCCEVNTTVTGGRM